MSDSIRWSSRSSRSTSARAWASWALRSAGAMRAITSPASTVEPLGVGTASTTPPASARTGVERSGRTSPSIVSARVTGRATEGRTSTATGSATRSATAGAASSSAPSIPLAIQPASASTSPAAIQPDQLRPGLASGAPADALGS